MLYHEEFTPHWEVWRSSGKRDDYFPNGHLILLCISMLELIFASPIASKAVINSCTNKRVRAVDYWKRIGID
jgi:hypothetical protein